MAEGFAEIKPFFLSGNNQAKLRLTRKVGESVIAIS